MKKLLSSSRNLLLNEEGDTMSKETFYEKFEPIGIVVLLAVLLLGVPFVKLAGVCSHYMLGE